MNQDLIFAPMGALAVLTFTVLSLVPLQRFRAVFAGRVVAGDFKLGESASVPPDVALPNRNYMNLLELPTLFFPACLMFYVTHRVDGPALGLAWAFVVFRTLHSLVHVTYNDVFHRLALFSLSVGTLAVFWIRFFV